MQEGGRRRQAAEAASVQLRGDDDNAAATGRLRGGDNVMQRQRVSCSLKETTAIRPLPAGGR